ncbi:NB-ARC - like 10, partial [Theobroma cacao]
RSELDELRKTLDIVKAVILDAEEKQESNLVVKHWIIRLEDVVSDAEDLLDEFDYEILRQKVRPRGQVRKIFRSFRMGPRVKEIRERLEVVAREINTFDFNVRVVELDKKRKNTDRETASKVRPELVIGREEDKEHIIELLKEQNHGDSNFNIIAIVGFGGLGKTSLARLVYNDAQVADSFKGIWILFPCLAPLQENHSSRPLRNFQSIIVPISKDGGRQRMRTKDQSLSCLAFLAFPS